MSATARPVKAAAGELVETRMTVNGVPAAIALPPRVTLADALRDQLGLTGTHVGCEHGVCGMCTVLADGEAVRSCLLLAVQADGAQIVTVEGLGRPRELHPLQASFGRNHALQCGFCTPGFLLSSYDLLTSKPGVTDEELPAELSGVICRCTGYRNILAAVAEVRDAYPDGVPPPGNCGHRAPAGRPAAAVQPQAPEQAGQVTLPAGDPTVTVQAETDIAVPAARVWEVFADTRLLARCLPGAELTGELGGNRYAGRARVSAGPVKLTFAGLAAIVEFNPGAARMRVLAQGQDASGAGTQAEIVLRTQASAAGTTLHADARLYLTGRIAQFGRGLAGDVSRAMFAQFAAAVAEAAVSGEAPSGRPPEPSAAGLLFASLAARIRRITRRRRLRG
jgi:carbon-monoxide dehydrogenase small subunit